MPHWHQKLSNLNMKKFKKGDEVIVISGSSKGKTGKILSVNANSVVIEGVNLAKVHKKPTSNEAGKIISVEKSVHLSKISHVENGKPVKISFVVKSGEGKAFSRKSRISKKTKKEI